MGARNASLVGPWHLLLPALPDLPLVVRDRADLAKVLVRHAFATREPELPAVSMPNFVGHCGTVKLYCRRKVSEVAVRALARLGQRLGSSSALTGSGTCRPTDDG